MPADNLTDVPFPVDHNFQDIADARAWTEQVMSRRPYRADFFEMFVRELRDANARTVLELGSGPGFLARHILESLSEVEYTALDFSPAMHTLARERLGALAARVRFVEASFKEPGWDSELPVFDAVISMQAAHEVRHKLRIPALYAAIHGIVRDGGVFLVCDVLPTPDSKSAGLHMTLAEQENALSQAGFSEVQLLLEKGDLGMWRAQKPGK